MSELKDYKIMDIEAMDDERLEKSESGKIQVTRVYIKSEADEVIAKLKEKLVTTEKLLTKALDCISNGKKHLMSLARKNNHANYKRCIAMAEQCKESLRLMRTYEVTDDFWNLEFGHDAEYFCKRGDFYKKWRKRWLELAEQFKE